MLYMKAVKKVNSKSSCHKKKNSSFLLRFLFLLYLCEMMDAN